jgi:16S rRNA (cytosine1402-N4)-methyltransferase
MADGFLHRPVLLEEALHFLLWRRGGVYVDATVGTAGHTEAILMRDPAARVLGFDADAAAIEISRSRLEVFGARFQLFHSNFSDMASYLKNQDTDGFDGILADLGFSSMQLDDPCRGFSFQQDGPLDMRMDQRQPRRAEDVINQLSERDLADLIYRYGEERYSRRIARAIVARRPLTSTAQLAEVVAKCFPRSHKRRIHPATRTFQALRIFVNDELDVLSRFLNEIPSLLAPRGRAVVISFHSLEDRLVKQTFREWQRQSLARVLTPHVVMASEAEQRENPRSRSAKLRAAEKSETQGAMESERQRRGAPYE